MQTQKLHPLFYYTYQLLLHVPRDLADASAEPPGRKNRVIAIIFAELGVSLGRAAFGVQDLSLDVRDLRRSLLAKGALGLATPNFS